MANAKTQNRSVSAPEGWDSLRAKVGRLMEHSSGYSRWFDLRLRSWQLLHLFASIGIVATTATSSILSKVEFESAAASAAIPVIGSSVSGGLATFLLWGQTHLRALIRAQQEAGVLSKEIRDWVRANEAELDDSRGKHNRATRTAYRTFRDEMRLRYREISHRVSSTTADEITRGGGSGDKLGIAGK